VVDRRLAGRVDGQQLKWNPPDRLVLVGRGVARAEEAVLPDFDALRGLFDVDDGEADLAPVGPIIESTSHAPSGSSWT
jgi:hypothetical protein